MEPDKRDALYALIGYGGALWCAWIVARWVVR